jgi:hypothetical protein
MGKVHALIGEQLKAAEAEAVETPSLSLRDGLVAKAREIVDRMLTHWANLDDKELKVIVDDLAEWEKMADSAIEQMGKELPTEAIDEVSASVAPTPSVTSPPTPEPVADEAGQGAATDDPPQVPSQLDPISSAEDGPVSRGDFQGLLGRVMVIENYIKRYAPDFS